MKMTDDSITKRKALLADIIPLGISLIAVLGFLASKLLSKYLLKAIAALRAETMQMRTRMNFNIGIQNKKFVTS